MPVMSEIKVNQTVLVKVGLGTTAVVVPLAVFLRAVRRSKTMQHVLAMAARNQVLMAFVVPTFLATALYALKVLGEQIFFRVKPLLVSTIEISSQDENFTNVLQFISKRTATNTLAAETSRNKNKTWSDWRKQFTQGDRSPPKFQFRPANSGALTSFDFKGHTLFLYRSPPQTITVGWSRTPANLEKMTISTWSGPEVLQDLFNTAIREGFQEQRDELTVFVRTQGWLDGWEKALSKARRPKDSVVLEPGLAESIAADAQQFLDNAEWYYDKGIPYRRGYLLYGPPGCGKTSFCQYLAGELKLDLCLLNLSDDNLTDEGLASLLRDSPQRSLILLEDVDSVFVGRDLQTAQKGRVGISFSGLLNAIDGVASQEGRLFCMTSNHPEKLDPALVRPGRVDVRVELKRASKSQAQSLFMRFFPNETALAEEFMKKIPDYKVSMAQLQGHLVENQSSAKQAVESTTTLLKEVRQDSQATLRTVRQYFAGVPPLEQLAPVLEERGFVYQKQLKGLKASDVKEWCKGFGILTNDLYFNKLNEALTTPLPDDYKEGMEMLDHNHIRSQVHAQYSRKIGEFRRPSVQVPGSSGSTPATSPNAGALALFKQNSFSAESDLTLEKYIEELVKVLTDKDGRGLVSCFQLEHHLHLYADSLQRAVKTVETLKRRENINGKGILASSVHDFLIRLGLDKHSYTLEDAGYLTLKSLVGATEDDITGAGVPKKDAKTIIAVLTENKAGSTVLDFQLVDRYEMVLAFKERFPSAPRDAASQFADDLTNVDGYGKVSQLQLRNFLNDCSGHVDALNGAEELSRCERKPRVEEKKPEDPKDWIFKQLKGIGLENYAQSFIDAGLADKKDFGVGEIKLTMDDLKSLGVDKLGHRMKIMNFISNHQ